METSEVSARATTPHPSLAPRTARAKIRRHADRAVPHEIEPILVAGRLAHVAYVVDGEPRVIPFLYHYDAGRIILHGAPGSSTLGRLRGGTSVAISVTLMEALIASRDAEAHSANYRSVVAYGTTRRIRDLGEKRRVLESMTGRYFPGRTVGRDYVAATDKQLGALEVIEVLVDEAAAKARSGGPMGPRDADPDAPGSAGIFPLSGASPD